MVASVREIGSPRYRNPPTFSQYGLTPNEITPTSSSSARCGRFTSRWSFDTSTTTNDSALATTRRRCRRCDPGPAMRGVTRATVRGSQRTVPRDSASNGRRPLHVHRSGDSGSPGVSACRLRPPPPRRTRPTGGASTSASPLIRDSRAAVPERLRFTRHPRVELPPVERRRACRVPWPNSVGAVGGRHGRWEHRQPDSSASFRNGPQSCSIRYSCGVFGLIGLAKVFAPVTFTLRLYTLSKAVT